LHLIIVEGIPGSGKSTTARFISLQAERNGIETKLFHESAFQHPIFLDHEVTDPIHWRKIYLTNLDLFLAALPEDHSVIVMESVLFQNPIIEQLHLDAGRDDIIRFIEEIYLRLAEINCTLIYLYQDDPAVGIQSMMTERGGENWLKQTYEKYKHLPYYENRSQLSENLHLDFLHEYAGLARDAYARCKLNRLAIDNTAWEWPQYYNNILEFLNLTYMPDPILSPQELMQYVGSFQNVELGVSIHIELQNEQLIIFGNQQLKPRGVHTFYLDQISMSLEFISNDAGGFSSLIITEKDLVGNQKDEGTIFKRIS